MEREREKLNSKHDLRGHFRGPRKGLTAQSAFLAPDIQWVARYCVRGDGIDGAQHPGIFGRFVSSPRAAGGTHFSDGNGIGPPKGTGGKVSYRQKYPCLGLEPAIGPKSAKVQDWCNEPAQFPSYRPGTAPSLPRRQEQVLALQIYPRNVRGYYLSATRLPRGLVYRGRKHWSAFSRHVFRRSMC